MSFPKRRRSRPVPFHLALATVAALLVVLTGGFLTVERANAAPSEFVQRCGIRFCLGGRTFYFAGANTYDLFTFGSGSGETETRYMDKARIDAHLSDIAADNVTVVRLWMFSMESWHGFETAEGVYNEQQFALFDYIIESARAHNIRLIPVFENYWEAYGGIDRRLQWEGLSGGHPRRGQFFSKTRCPGCFESYKNYVSHALNRTNHYSGVKYKDEPAIMAWELMNEPRYQDQVPNENTTGTTLRAWVDEMGAFIKGIDPNHLLGTGLEAHETRYGFGGDEGNPFVYIHQSPYIDFTSAHPYPTEHWADLDLEETKALIRQWISDSHDLVGKPFVMGEFNMHNVDRVTWWREIYAEFEAAGGDGSAFWWYADREIDGKFGVTKGDPELAVFKAHSANMMARSGGPPPTLSPTTSPTASPTTSPPTSPTASPTVSPTASPSPTPTSAAGCRVRYDLSDWGSSFNAGVTITNSSAVAINGWTLEFSFPGDQSINSIWNATAVQSGRRVTATNAAWTATIAPGGSVNFGLNGNSTAGTNGVPTVFVINGTVCAIT